ncbi:hypothetical protein [Dissulfuribacter thermophilus]|uniref:hypothetical protein n=1 Tax=Dissulfuribacter thermophilus TaxID=1156395 RepID=UPI0008339832|nr:hypothetical protein [Dissulfuribacter thermophilus]
MFRIHLLFAVCMSLVLSGCSHLYSSSQNGPVTKIPEVKRIAVLPLDRARIKPGQEKATCALTDTVFDVSEVPEEASLELTRVLFDLLKNKSNFFPVPEGQCVGFLSSLIESNVKASQIRLIQAFGRDLGADAVLYGVIYRYHERMGGDYAASKPASVAFALHLIRVQDGKVLWHYNFDETQRPLTSNLFKFGLFKETGMKWVTAEKLGEIGLKRAVQDLLNRLP